MIEPSPPAHPLSPRGHGGGGGNNTKNHNTMIAQLENQPSKESMIQEFGVDGARLHAAQEAIRSCAGRSNDLHRGEAYYPAPAVARVLMDCGLVEAFTLYCLLPGAKRCRFAVLPAWVGSPTCGGLLTVRAEFDDSGAIKMLEGELDEGEPFGMSLDGMLAALPLHVLKDAEWRKSQWKAIRSYEASCVAEDSYPWKDLVAVVRFPLSPTMALRKFLNERWHDPGVTQSERFACPLDRKAWEAYASRRATVTERFQQVLDESDGV